jgi:predicted metalloprotease with PDZ domain
MRIAERIENLTLRDTNGAHVAVRKIAPGEYQAEGEATSFSYELKLQAPEIATDAAHVSWLTAERGFLMLGDLLPRLNGEKEKTNSSAVLTFKLPAGWTQVSTIKASVDASFNVADTESAVFYVGQDLREKRERVASMDFTFVGAGNWSFTDQDVIKTASDILASYAQMTGRPPHSSVMLMLSPFPVPVVAGRWSAETRGSTVILLSGMSPSKIAALAQLTVPLTHELLHLWVPNALALAGDYDWFYEGFTVYQATRAGLRLKHLSFQDYLNAVGRAYDGYLSLKQRDTLSLPDASERRWTGPISLVYHKGMLVAFLYDLTLTQQTKGKRTLDDAYRELFRHQQMTAKRQNGNAAVIAALNSVGDMQSFIRRYVESASSIDLAQAIAPYGLRVEQWGGRTRLVVAESLSGGQRDLLRKFGYNEKDYEPRRRTR